MSQGDTHPEDDKLELAPATDGQIEEIAASVGQILDGSLTLARKRSSFNTDYFAGEFFQHFAVQYSHSDGSMEQVGDDEARKVFDYPWLYLPSFTRLSTKLAGIENKAVGLALEVADAGPDYDQTTLDFSVAPDEGRLSYHLFRGPSHISGNPTPLIDIFTPPESATDEQARIIQNITSLVLPFYEDVSSVPAEDLAPQLVEQLDVLEEIPRLDLLPIIPAPEVLSALSAQVWRPLNGQPTVAEFFHSFGSNQEGGSVNMVLELNESGRHSRKYQVTTGVPAGASGTDVFVSTLRLDGDTIEYREHFDVDFDSVVKKEELADPDFDSLDALPALVENARREREESKEQFEAERADGFHEFSQADANRIIQALSKARAER